MGRLLLLGLLLWTGTALGQGLPPAAPGWRLEAERADLQPRRAAPSQPTRPGLVWTGETLSAGLSGPRTPLLEDVFGVEGEARLSLTTTAQAGRFRLTGAISAVEDRRDGAQLWLDGSEVALDLAPWRISVGAVERHWSPSRHSSLIYGRAARPVPGIAIERTGNTPLNLPLLRFLGPWQASFFVGQLEEARVVPNTKFLAFRSSIEPLPGLRLGILRSAQWGGDGRPEGGEAFWRTLIGRSNTGGAITAENDPSNQLGGVEGSWRLPDWLLPLRLYTQIIGEDEVDAQPTKLMYLHGAELSTRWGQFTGEYLDTRASKVGFAPSGLAYNNFVYLSGYTHRGRVLGAAIEADSTATRLFGAHQGRWRGADVSLDWGVGRYTINDADLATHRLSSRRVRGTLAHARVGLRRGKTELGLGLTWQDFTLDQVGIGPGLRAGLSVSRQF